MAKKKKPSPQLADQLWVLRYTFEMNHGDVVNHITVQPAFSQIRVRSTRHLRHDLMHETLRELKLPSRLILDPWAEYVLLFIATQSWVTREFQRQALHMLETRARRDPHAWLDEERRTWRASAKNLWPPQLKFPPIQTF